MMYQKFDSCFATIIKKHGHAGVSLRLDNNQEAFAHSFAANPIGTKVICSIIDDADDRRLIAKIESVNDDREAA